MRPLTIKEIQQSVQGILLQGDPDLSLPGVAINSKLIKPGQVFVAIKGKRLDGHRFCRMAVRKGAAALLVSADIRRPPASIAVIKVPDTTMALGRLARFYRDQFDIPVIGITGSAGKTTTKEMVAHVLSARYKVLKNTGSENNHIGVPMTLLKIDPSHDIVVVEMGTNQRGDIPWLTRVAHPTIAVITNIGESHLELLRNPAGVFKEKAALVRGLPKTGVAILNSDDNFLKKIKARRQFKLITYGTRHGADYQARDIALSVQRTIHFRVNQRHCFSLSTLSLANVSNALAAISCGRLFNISYNDINCKLKRVGFQKGRQRIIRAGKHWLFDDTYNANPLSVRNALQTFAAAQCPGRKIFVCGDMLELGERSTDLHREMGKLAKQLGMDAVLALGERARFLAEAASPGSEERPSVTRHFLTRASLHRYLSHYVQEDDAFLIKGSRGMRMEKTRDFLIRLLEKGK